MIYIFYIYTKTEMNIRETSYQFNEDHSGESPYEMESPVSLEGSRAGDPVAASEIPAFQEKSVQSPSSHSYSATQ